MTSSDDIRYDGVFGRVDCGIMVGVGRTVNDSLVGDGRTVCLAAVCSLFLCASSSCVMFYFRRI